MAVEIITKEDLMKFKYKLLSELQTLLSTKMQQPKKWLKTREVTKMLQISPGVNLIGFDKEVKDKRK